MSSSITPKPEDRAGGPGDDGPADSRRHSAAGFFPRPDPSPEPDSSSDWIVAYCDGGSRGNPGPAGFGVYIEDGAGRILAEESEYLGIRTNNFAEYSALLAAIEFAVSHGHRRLRVIADSELIVKQMQGRYRVNSPELRPLYEQARRRIPALEKFEIRHVLREKNRHADRLANRAMDRGMGKPAPPGASAASLSAAAASRPLASPPLASKMLRGLVKGGVVHLLSGELPDGAFVKVIPE